MKRVKIPEERVGVLIGENGEILERIEEDTSTSIEVDGNEASIEGDALEEMTAQKIVKAIGRGFTPEKALRLVEECVEFHHIDVSDYASSRNSRDRLKGRVIGRDGEAREHIEKMTGVDLAVYGKTIGFVGPMKSIQVALEAVKMLMNGSSHASAWDYLERNQGKVVR